MIALIVIAILAALVITGMIWGHKKARERHRVEEAADERTGETGADLPAPPPPPTDKGGALPPEEPRPAPETASEPILEQAVKEAVPPPASAPPPPPTTEPLAARELAPEPIPAPVVEPDTAAAANPAPDIAPAPEPVAPEPVSVPAAPEPAPALVPPAVAESPGAAPGIAAALALTTIKGLGPKVAAMLAEHGISRVDQLAALSADEASALDVQLGAFTGRMARDRWIDQARLLAAGDTAAYEAAFGKLG